MYVTRPLSRYYNFPDAVLEPPPDGPHSGILVIEDDEAEAQTRCCWGICKSPMSSLPFPQNRKIQVQYTTGSGQNRRTHRDDVFFIPVTGLPLSNNCYYVLRAQGKNKGKACLCSKEEDVSTFCLCRCVNDVKPSPFDYRDIYQRVEVIRKKRSFHARAVAFDGFPPMFLRRKGWIAYTSVSSNNIHRLGEALGLDTNLRNQMPNLNFPITSKYSHPVVVGKWYIPYIFIKDYEALKDQMKKSMFYEMTLEQSWENICASENIYGSGGNVVEVGVSVVREMALLNGTQAVRDDIETIDGVVQFKPANSVVQGLMGLGLSLAIWERMKWEEERGGWVGVEKVERVERMEIYEGVGGWRNFGCFVLVERFVLRKMDGSLALTYDFKHTNKVRIRWE